MMMNEKDNQQARKEMIRVGRNLEEISRKDLPSTETERKILSEQFKYYSKRAGYGPRITDSYLSAYTLGLNTRMTEEESNELNSYFDISA
jgi:hypothetical protein